MNRATRRPAAASSPTSNATLVRYLTEQQVKALIACVGSHGRHPSRDVALVTLMYHHALRVSEAIGLKWSAIDLKARTITLHRAKGGRPSVQPLYPSGIRALKALRAPGSGHVFIDHFERPMKRNAVAMLLRRRGPQAGIGHVHPHQLRHACGYKLTNDGVDLRVVGDHLGHQSLQSTLRYTQVAPARHAGLFK